MKVKDALQKYYDKHPFFGVNGGQEENTIKVYLGNLDMQVPNFEFRKRLVPYHDLNHMISGYNNSRAGEGEVSAWELGTGTLSYPLATFYSMAGFTTGMLVDRKRTYEAFIRGRSCKNLYKYDLNILMEMEFSDIKEESLHSEKKSFRVLDKPLFFLFSVASSFFAIAYYMMYGASKALSNA